MSLFPSTALVVDVPPLHVKMHLPTPTVIVGPQVVEASRSELECGLPAFELFRRAGLAVSNGEARRLIKGGGARLNNVTIHDELRAVTTADLDADGLIKLSAGKKRHALVRIV